MPQYCLTPAVFSILLHIFSTSENNAVCLFAGYLSFYKKMLLISPLFTIFNFQMGLTGNYNVFECMRMNFYTSTNKLTMFILMIGMTW